MQLESMPSLLVRCWLESGVVPSSTAKSVAATADAGSVSASCEKKGNVTITAAGDKKKVAASVTVRPAAS